MDSNKINDIIEILNNVSMAVCRIELNCEEKHGLNCYKMYDDICEIQDDLDKIKSILKRKDNI